MSLYALIRNSYDPVTKEFHLSASDIELEGHLDGNLCRCTGYKPILDAAKTFITEDLNGKIADSGVLEIDFNEECEDVPYRSESNLNGALKSKGSCGRPGGCCRDPSKNAKSSPKPSDDSDSGSLEHSTSSESSATSPDEGETSAVSGASYGKAIKSNEVQSANGTQAEGTKTTTHLDALSLPIKAGILQYDFIPYSPNTELIFPPALRKFQKEPLLYGNSTQTWLRPINLEQLLLIKDAYPAAKLVGGSSEVQVEIRFKNSSFPICVYVSEIEELRGIQLPEDINSMDELVIAANTPLTEVEAICQSLFTKLGQRASVLEAVRKQLRYFAGRQIRNVASLAGNIATASPISDINPVLMACGAKLTAQSLTKGKFVLPMETFFVEYRTTTLPVDAVITHIHIPLAPLEVKEATIAYKQAKRKDDDIAIVTAAFRVRIDTEGLISDIALAYGGMARKTVLATTTMTSLLGKKWHSSATLNSAISSLAAEFPLSYDVPGGMATYRRTLTLSLFFRFWHSSISSLLGVAMDPSLVDEIHRSISHGSRDNYNPHEQRVVGKQIPHLSALKQNTGEAQYVDDMPRQDRELYGAMVLSSCAHAKLVSVDWTPAIGEGLAVGYVDKNSITKEANLWGSVVKDEPFFADGEVHSHGQPIGMVYAETALQAQAAAKKVKVVYEDLPVILTIDEAIEAKSFFKHGKILKKGVAIEDKMDGVWSQCERIFEGVTRMGGQEHFYLETNVSLVIPNKDDGTFEVWSSTQNT
jgi:xanthine dehydrogenase/oxidase